MAIKRAIQGTGLAVLLVHLLNLVALGGPEHAATAPIWPAMLGVTLFVGAEVVWRDGC